MKNLYLSLLRSALISNQRSIERVVGIYITEKDEVKLFNLESITPQTLEEAQQTLKENLDR
jgi:hypothetical protein